jgi:integrase
MVFSTRDQKMIRKHFHSKREAERWRSELLKPASEGNVIAPSKTTLKEAAEALVAGMKDGTIQNRSGRVYRPATIRRYQLALDNHLLPTLGRLPVGRVDRAQIRALFKGWQRDGQAPSSIRNNLDPLRVIFREAIEDGDKGITDDPMAGMKLPAGTGRRERVADRAEAQALIDALNENERALWACAFYGGLRRGELRALRWSDVDFEAGEIHVERGWDDMQGEQAPKTDAGARTVPLAGVLRRILVAHKLASQRHDDDLVFGRTAREPFVASTVRTHARAAWQAENERRKKQAQEQGTEPVLLAPITLHEARHSAASYLIHAGLNDLEMMKMIGHTDPRTTKMIYGKLFSDSTDTVKAKLDVYLEPSKGARG